MSDNAIDTTSIAYTIGLLTGEGSFFVTLTRDDRYRYGVYYGPKFAVSMGQFSQEMLQKQQELYGLGTVNKSPKGYQWICSSRKDCHALRDLIDEYAEEHGTPRFTSTPKYETYRRWCDALELLRPGHQLTKNEIIQLAELREQINGIAASTRITADEIKEIVEQNEE